MKGRKDFEAWLNQVNQNCTFPFSLEREDEDNYLDDSTQLAWKAWQEAWARATIKPPRKRVVRRKRKAKRDTTIAKIKRMSR